MPVISTAPAMILFSILSVGLMHHSALSFSIHPSNKHFHQGSLASGKNSVKRGKADNTNGFVPLQQSKNANADLFSSDDSSKLMEGCICVVTGASRGIGKGIAIELGKAGATVYVTGTSTVSRTSSSSDGGSGSVSSLDESKFLTNEVVGGPASENIEATAEEINQAGGVGIPVCCDHSQDDQVRSLFDRIEREHGRLDLLVNNVFRVPPGGTDGLFGKFWEVGVDAWDYVHTVGCRSHYVASCYAVPLMKKNQPSQMGKMKRPMIAMISSFGGLTYTFNVPYGVGKAAVDRLAKDMAVELREENISCTSFYPGLVMTERTQRTVETGEWDKNVGIPLENAETPRYTGRGIIAVATDQEDGSDSAVPMAKTGTFQVVAELAKEYGFTDENGRQPPSIRSLKFLLPAYGFDEETRKKVPDFLIPDWKLPFFVMAQGAPPKKEE